MGSDSEARNRIITEAIKLFSVKGFSAVSTRDIARTVGMNIASIYYYYESKEALLDAIFAYIEIGYRHYIDWLAAENAKVDTVEELMDNMFNAEFIEMHNPMTCMGMSLAIKEQHSNARARKLVADLFFEYSIRSLQADFDSLVKKGVIRQSDTKTIAMILMVSVMVINDLRLHEFTDSEPVVDHMEIYMNLKKHITDTLTHGN